MNASAAKQTASHHMNIDVGPKGRGLFAACDIPPNTVLHGAPCLRIDSSEYAQHMRHTVLEHYLFNTKSGDKLLALGYGSLFNHSRHPYVDSRVNLSKLQIVCKSGHKAISRNEELCITFGSGKLWFDDAEDLDSKVNGSRNSLSICPGFSHARFVQSRDVSLCYAILASRRYSAKMMYAGSHLSQFSSFPSWCSHTTLE